MNDVMMQRAPLSRDGAAEYLGISVRKLDYLREEGGVVAHYVGVRPMFLPEELDQWLRAQPTERPGRKVG